MQQAYRQLLSVGCVAALRRMLMGFCRAQGMNHCSAGTLAVIQHTCCCYAESRMI